MDNIPINHYLIITIGTRDVAFSNNTPPHIFQKIHTKSINNYIYPSSPREDGLNILNQIHDFIPFIQLPLIEPVVNNLYQHYHSPQNLLFPILIATDQPESNPMPYRKNDTLHYAHIIQKYLTSKYQIPEDNFTLHLVSIPELNLYDQMYDYFQQHNTVFEILPPFKIFFLPQGGIDAINTTLMLFLNENYSSIHQLYIDENQHILELSFPIKFKLKLIEKLIENNDYHALMNINFISSNFQLKELLQHISNALNYNFQSNTFLHSKYNIPDTKEDWIALKLFLLIQNKDYFQAVTLLISIMENFINNIFQHFNIPTNTDFHLLFNYLDNNFSNLSQQFRSAIEPHLKNFSENEKPTLLHKLKLCELLLNKFNAPNIRNKKKLILFLFQTYYNLYKERNQFVHKLHQNNIKPKLIQNIQNSSSMFYKYLQISPELELSKINQTIKNLILQNN